MSDLIPVLLLMFGSVLFVVVLLGVSTDDNLPIKTKALQLTILGSVYALVLYFCVVNLFVGALSDMELEYIGEYYVIDNEAGAENHKQYIIVEGEYLFFEKQKEKSFHVYYLEYHRPFLSINDNSAKERMKNANDFTFTGKGYIRVTARDMYWESKSKKRKEN